jgi:hypothetical protein
MSESTTRTEADAVIEQTLLGMQPTELYPDNIYAIRTPNGYATIDLTKEEILKAAGFPRSSAKSSYAFHSIESFTLYAKGVFDACSVELDNIDNVDYIAYRRQAICIADEDRGTIRLIFDASPNEWGDVYAELQLHSFNFPG